MTNGIKKLTNKELYKAFSFAQKHSLDKEFLNLLGKEIMNRSMPLPLNFLTIDEF